LDYDSNLPDLGATYSSFPPTGGSWATTRQPRVAVDRNRDGDARPPGRSHWSPSRPAAPPLILSPNRASSISDMRRGFGLEVAAIALVVSSCTVGPSE